jgi:hypothetical protein
MLAWCSNEHKNVLALAIGLGSLAYENRAQPSLEGHSTVEDFVEPLGISINLNYHFGKMTGYRGASEVVGEIGDGLTGRDPFERYSIVLLLRLF